MFKHAQCLVHCNSFMDKLKQTCSVCHNVIVPYNQILDQYIRVITKIKQGNTSSAYNLCALGYVCPTCWSTCMYCLNKCTWEQGSNRCQVTKTPGEQYHMLSTCSSWEGSTLAEEQLLYETDNDAREVLNRPGAYACKCTPVLFYTCAHWPNLYAFMLYTQICDWAPMYKHSFDIQRKVQSIV